MTKSIPYFLFVLLIFGALSMQPVVAADAWDKASNAVANILFDYDGSHEFATYLIKENGSVDITFARNTPDKLYGEILTKLKNHTDIKGVLAGKGGPICSLW